jgi:DNA-binding CsgD family transcriptional regulator
MSKVKAARSLNLARSIRGELSSHDRNRIQEGVLMEVICLGANGQWLQARRLCEQGIGSSPGLAAAKEMLRRFCDGPPFVGLREALAPCVGRPFVGLAALLVARVVDRLGVPDATGSLTAAELDVLRLLSLGKSNKAIADARSRSTETVKRQVAAIYKKLGVENRTSALAAAKELGIV